MPKTTRISDAISSSEDLHLYAILLAEVLRDEFDFVTCYDVYDQMLDDLRAQFDAAQRGGLTPFEETHLDGLCYVAVGEVDEEMSRGFLHYCGGDPDDLAELVEADLAHRALLRMATRAKSFYSFYEVHTARGVFAEDHGDEAAFSGPDAIFFVPPGATRNDWRAVTAKHGTVLRCEGQIVRLLVGKHGTLDYRVLAERQ